MMMEGHMAGRNNARARHRREGASESSSSDHHRGRPRQAPRMRLRPTTATSPSSFSHATKTAAALALLLAGAASAGAAAAVEKRDGQQHPSRRWVRVRGGLGNVGPPHDDDDQQQQQRRRRVAERSPVHRAHEQDGRAEAEARKEAEERAKEELGRAEAMWYGNVEHQQQEEEGLVPQGRGVASEPPEGEVIPQGRGGGDGEGVVPQGRDGAHDPSGSSTGSSSTGSSSTSSSSSSRGSASERSPDTDDIPGPSTTSESPGDAGGVMGPCQTLEDNRQKWTEQDLTDYDYDYLYVLGGVAEEDDGGSESQDFLSVRVRDSEITWAKYADGAMVPSGIADGVPTITDLFDSLRTSCAYTFATFVVTYDSRMGYPRTIDHGNADAADSYSITIKDLRDAKSDGPDLSLPAPNPARDKYSSNKARWDAAHVNEYSYVFQWGKKKPVRVRVRNGKVVEVSRPMNKKMPLTVEQMFKLIRDAIDKDQATEVSYNSEKGYPTKIKIKRGRRGIRTVRISVKRLRIKEDDGPDMSNPNPNAPSEQELLKAMQLWNSKGITDYAYRYRRRCEGGMPPEDCSPVCVTVRDGSVAKAEFAGDAVVPTGDGGDCSGGDVPEDLADQLPTVEDLFGILGGDGTVVAAAFDSDMGFPTSGHVVQSGATMPFVFTVSDLEENDDDGPDRVVDRPNFPGYCTADVKVCDDGTTRSRNPQKDCAFDPPCPEDVSPELISPADLVNPGFNDGPKFPGGHSQGFCTNDVFGCEDGTTRSRDPQKNCDFNPPCPDGSGPELVSGPGHTMDKHDPYCPECCTGDGDCYDGHENCEDGSYVCRRGPQCEYPMCDLPGSTGDAPDGPDMAPSPPTNPDGSPVRCRLDSRKCPDTDPPVWVYRDPDSPNCSEFKPCTREAVQHETKGH